MGKTELQKLIQDLIFVPYSRIKSESKKRSNNEENSEMTSKLFQFHQYLTQYLENKKNFDKTQIESQIKRNQVQFLKILN